MQRFTRFITCLILAAMVGLVVAGCNTVEGVGKDVEKAGEAVQDAAK